jgi:hypothetical protein
VALNSSLYGIFNKEVRILREMIRQSTLNIYMWQMKKAKEERKERRKEERKGRKEGKKKD